MKKLLIVDGNSLMHRAFHALPLMDADGVYTNAIYGFLNILEKVEKEEQPEAEQEETRQNDSEMIAAEMEMTLIMARAALLK